MIREPVPSELAELTAYPSLDDPLVLAASEGIGGPVGDHHAPHPWWTPVRVVLAVFAVFFALGMLQKAPCVAGHWNLGDERYAKMCYSDIPYLYTGRGFAELTWPYSDTGGRYDVMEYPVGISYVAYGAAQVTHWLSGSPDLRFRATVNPERLWGMPRVADEVDLYFRVTAWILAAFGLLAAFFLAGASPGRPWDAMAFAAAPTMALTALINWDLVAVALVAGALWAWARGRPGLTGLMIGLGAATKLYPLFLLGPLVVICLRRRRYAEAATATGAAVLAWIVLNMPAWATGFEQWKVFWRFNSERGADLGSVWLLFSERVHHVDTHTINLVSLLFFAAVCLGTAVLGLRAPSTPRLAQLSLLVVIGFLLVNKVYSPQYVLWILPLAVLARPRWRDLLIWQAGELFYFAAVWLYLGGYTSSAVTDAPDPAYTLAIVVRILAELFLAFMVVRDIVRDDDPAPDPTEVPRAPWPSVRTRRSVS